MKPHYRLPCHGGRWSVIVIAGLRRHSWLSAPVDVEAELQLGLELGLVILRLASGPLALRVEAGPPVSVKAGPPWWRMWLWQRRACAT